MAYPLVIDGPRVFATETLSGAHYAMQAPAHDGSIGFDTPTERTAPFWNSRPVEKAQDRLFSAGLQNPPCCGRTLDSCAGCAQTARFPAARHRTHREKPDLQANLEINA